MDNKREGICKSYYDDEKIKVEEEYISDNRNGIYKKYDKYGKEEETGVCKSYVNEFGKLDMEIYNIDGRKNAIYKKYNQYDYVIETGIYKPHFDDSGKLYMEEYQVDGKKTIYKNIIK